MVAGEASVNAATIAEFEKDHSALKAIAEAYVEDAEKFWSDMGGTFDDEASDGEERAASVIAGRKVKRLHRTKVWKWLLITWRMMKCILNVGWTFFQQPVDVALRQHPLAWPSISVSLDQGSDGWSAGDAY